MTKGFFESNDWSSFSKGYTDFRIMKWPVMISVAVVLSGYVFAYLANGDNVYIAGLPMFQVGSGKLREGVIEYVEALFWFIALVLYLVYFKSSLKESRARSIWAFCFVLLCFFALGEELSWGQHLFGFDTPAAVNEVNAQRELNIHNVNVARILGLSEGSYWEQRLSNVTKLLNPLFYLVCISAWVLVPVVLTINSHWRVAFFATYPKFGLLTVSFLSANVLAFALLDRLFFDVGEIFELALPLTAWLSGLELRNYAPSSISSVP